MCKNQPLPARLPSLLAALSTKYFVISYLLLAVIEKLYHIFTREMEIRQTPCFKLFYTVVSAENVTWLGASTKSGSAHLQCCVLCCPLREVPGALKQLSRRSISKGHLAVLAHVFLLHNACLTWRMQTSFPFHCRRMVVVVSYHRWPNF